jgi:hypothetical protein
LERPVQLAPEALPGLPEPKVLPERLVRRVTPVLVAPKVLPERLVRKAILARPVLKGLRVQRAIPARLAL